MNTRGAIWGLLAEFDSPEEILAAARGTARPAIVKWTLTRLMPWKGWPRSWE